MLYFKRGDLPQLPYQLAVKKPIPIRCVQIHEPFTVETLEGALIGKAGDYLMIGVRDEMYPCDKDIFEETYELLPDNPANQTKT